MKKNMGNLDRVVRTLGALIIGFLYVTEKIDSFIAYTLILLGVIFLITSIASFCPLYLPLKMNTIDMEKK